MPPLDLGFLRTSITLRPPRVVIIVRADDRWRDWMMLALETATSYWGGGGFIVVPYDPKTGDADPALAEAVRAYDPDHVVSLRLSMQTIEAWYPGTITIGGVSDEAERLRLIANDRNHDEPDRASLRAREQVASWCSPMRSEHIPGEKELPYEVHQSLRPRDPKARWGEALAPNADRGDGTLLGASAHWRSDVGLYAAMRLGVLDDRPPYGMRPEAGLEALGWLVRNDGAPAATLAYGSPTPADLRTAEPAFTAGQRTLTVGWGLLRDRGVVVFGDTATDFALAMAYDRLFGRGVWITRQMVDDPDTFRRTVQPTLRMLKYDLERGTNFLVFTSASVPDADVKALANRIEESDTFFEVDGERVPFTSRRETVQVRRPVLERGVFSLVTDEHISVSAALPAARLPDGSREALIGLEVPTPTSFVFPESSGLVPYWYVDVAINRDAIPRGRDIPTHSVLASEGPIAEVNLRASRAGYSYSPQSMGIVPAGAILSSRIAKPILRALSMTAWVRAAADRAGLDVRLSAAGRRAELTASRLGERSDLLDLLTPEFVQMIKAFQSHETKPKPEDRNPHIFVDGLDPYLSYTAIERLLPGMTEDERHDLFDRLLTAGIFRRGFMLRCADCERPSFVDVDRLGREYECPQCGAKNPLVSARWKREHPEPTWFYDLYTPMRDLLRENGEVSLAAAATLRNGSRAFADSPELEFIDRETGKPIAEIDVIVNVNDSLAIVEAKSNGTFGSATERRSQVGKLLHVAGVIRADRIVLATSRETWTPADVEYLTKRAQAERPFPLDVNVLTNVGRPPTRPSITLEATEALRATLEAAAEKEEGAPKPPRAPRGRSRGTSAPRRGRSAPDPS